MRTATAGGAQPGQFLGGERCEVVGKVLAGLGRARLGASATLDGVLALGEQADPAQVAVVLVACGGLEALERAVLVEFVDASHADRLQHAARGAVGLLGDRDQRASAGDNVRPTGDGRRDRLPAKAFSPGGGEQLVGELGATLAPVVGADGHQADRPLVGGVDDSPGAGRRRAGGLPGGDAILRGRTGALTTVVTSDQQNKAVFTAANLPAPGPGKTYQLWLDHDGTMLPAGLIDRDGAVILTGDPADASAVGLTLEPDGGSPQPTTDPLLLMALPA